MLDFSALTVPEAVLILGVAGTTIAVYKGVLDSRKSGSPPPAPATHEASPAKEVTVDIDHRYVEAMETLAEAFRNLAGVNTKLGEANARQASAMEKLGDAVQNWIHKYERDKDSERMEALELRMAQIYNLVSGGEASRPLRRKSQSEDPR